jgi:CHAT domain-containing protein
LQRALALREQVLGPTHLEVALSLNDLARLYQDQGRTAEAEPLLQRALALCEQVSAPPPLYPVAQILNNLAGIYWGQGRVVEARALGQRVHALWEAVGSPYHVETAHGLGKAAMWLAQHNQRTLAHDLFEQARQIYLAVSQANADLEEEAARGLLRQHAATLQAYIALLATLAREPGGDPAPLSLALAAFVVAEQMRGGTVQLALARAGARAAAVDPATATLARQVEALRRQQQALGRQLSDAHRIPGMGGDARRPAAQQQALQQVDSALREATHRLYTAFPGYAELAAPTPIEVPAVQALLHPHEALLSWFTLPDRVLVWLVRPGQAPVYRDAPITQADLRAMVGRVRGSLERGPGQPFNVVEAHALYTLLLAPLREQLAGVTHLLLVPDEVLLPVPFGVLVTEATGEAYARLADLVRQPRLLPIAADFGAYAQVAWLAKDYALTTLPSATALRALRQRPRPQGVAREPLLAFGDPVLQGAGRQRGGAPMPAARGVQVPIEVLRQLPRLPETQAELQAIAAALGADPRQAIHVGARATEPMVQELNTAGRLGQAQVLAFATHALLAGELGGLTQPALVLTPPATPSEQDDGLLALDEVLGLKLPYTSWVVLSACNTAADDGSGEGLSGLARAFFFAGAAALLVSHWGVDDAATRVLMTEVFRRHAQRPDLTRAEALRQGMLAVMTGAQGPTAHFAHPFAWAPFVLVGEGSHGRP